MSEAMTITLISKEGTEHVCPVQVARMSGFIMDTIGENLEEHDEDNDDENGETPKLEEMPLPKVSDAILSKIIAFGTHYQTEEMKPIDTPFKSSKIEDLVQPWYCDFVKVDQKTLFELVAAANYMNIKQILDLTCLGVAILCQGKSEDELRKMFNVEKPTAEGESKGDE